MISINPLIRETLTGLRTSSQAQLDYLNYLLIQAAVLFLWWPKSSLVTQLESETEPSTLLAILIAVGVTLSYYAMRFGAEEVLLSNQKSIKEWLNQSLSLGCVLRGYLFAHLLQMLHALALSSPLLLMAHAVVGSDWLTLFWGISAILLLATFYRLLGVVFYMLIGQQEHILFISLRIILVLIYLVLGVLLPISSHWFVTSELIKNGFLMYASDGDLSNLSKFLLLYSVLCVLLICILYGLLSRHQNTETTEISK